MLLNQRAFDNTAHIAAAADFDVFSGFLDRFKWQGRNVDKSLEIRIHAVANFDNKVGAAGNCHALRFFFEKTAGLAEIFRFQVFDLVHHFLFLLTSAAFLTAASIFI